MEIPRYNIHIFDHGRYINSEPIVCVHNDHRDFRRLRVIGSSIIIAFQTFIPCRCHVALVYRS